MVILRFADACGSERLSVLALSSRFDGLPGFWLTTRIKLFQYSLCRVVLMAGVCETTRMMDGSLSVLALSSRFDGSW